MSNKEPIFIYDAIKREWKTIYVPSRDKNTSPYTFNKFKPSKSTNQYKSIQANKNKYKYKTKYKKNEWERKLEQ